MVIYLGSVLVEVGEVGVVGDEVDDGGSVVILSTLYEDSEIFNKVFLVPSPTSKLIVVVDRYLTKIDNIHCCLLQKNLV